MQKYLKSILYFFSFLNFIIIFSCEINKSNTDNNGSLFKLLSPEITNVTFQNTLTEGPNTNILMYEYFYNGGGVATADFNGDGLDDLYFTSNMGENKMYLNKGNMKFEDITEASGAEGRPGPWKTGVNSVDINADGKMDIYLCYSGAMPAQKRSNQLFINMGNSADGKPFFSEKAAEYGLDSQAFSNQAYFLDYDRDGDLDMLLLNHNPKSMPVLNEQQTIDMLKTDDPFIGLRLYQQNNGHFDDVTQGSGISSTALSYGLGIGISDLNGDNWPDFYVSNDYTIPDYLYINNQKGGFSDKLKEQIGHSSHFSMGNDVADINNDALPDIFTLDMLPEDNKRQKLLIAPDNYAKFDLNLRSGFHYQYMRNMLQINNGNQTFSEQGQLAGISNTDWSWSALFADFNLDGNKDLHITNGYKRDYTNLDFIKFMEDYVKEKGRLQRDDVLQIIEKMPASNVSNYIFENIDGLFKNQTKNWGLELPSNSNGAAYADLDNDGDLDLVVNNVNQAAFIYENLANKSENSNFLSIETSGEKANTHGIGAKICLYSGGKIQKLEQYPARGYLSAVSDVLCFGLGKNLIADSLIVHWPSGKYQKLKNVKANQKINLNEADAQPEIQIDVKPKEIFSQINDINYKANTLTFNDFSRQPLLLKQLSYSAPKLIKGDLNKDGLDDLVVAGSPLKCFTQSKNGELRQIQLPNEPNVIDASIADFNNDGNTDIYLAKGGYGNFNFQTTEFQDVILIGNGKGSFVKNEMLLPKIDFPKNIVRTIDINADGKLDIFLGGSALPGQWPKCSKSRLLLNNGAGKFSDVSERQVPEFQLLEMVSDAIVVDLDADKTNELIVVGEWAPIKIFNINKGKLVEVTNKYLSENPSGLYKSIAIAHLNNDQKPDIILGNQGLNNQFQASVEEPIDLIYNDFDKNGTVDPIFCYYIKGQSYPNITRDELFMQFAGFKAKYNSFESYSNATLTDIFSKAELESSKKLTVTDLKSAVLLSDKSGKYIKIALPISAQIAPVYSIIPIDFDKDKQQDLIITGGEKYSKLRLGKYDANNGTLLRNTGNGNFVKISNSVTGLKLSDDIQSGINLGNSYFFSGQSGKIQSFKLK